MKIAIIGAGPAGLYAALAAARQRIQVDLFEKRKVGEGIVCGECMFDSLGIMSPPGRGLLHPVNEIILKGQDHYTFPLSRYKKLWMLDRRIWQRELADTAKNIGAIIHENSKITLARLREMQKEYDWIIDASGAPSITSRAYNFSADYFKEFLLAHQIVLADDFSEINPRIKIGFFTDLPHDCQPAYYWIFPRDARRANVGVVCTVRGTLGKSKLDLKKVLATVLNAEGLEDGEIMKKGSGVIAAGQLTRLIYDNIILTGDAAGLASALHGGGIDMACLSGVLAVSAITGNQEGFTVYEKNLQEYLSEKLALENIAIRKMRTMKFDQFDKLLQEVTSPSRFIRLKASLCHPEMFYTTMRWFFRKKKIPAWPV